MEVEKILNKLYESPDINAQKYFADNPKFKLSTNILRSALSVINNLNKNIPNFKLVSVEEKLKGWMQFGKNIINPHICFLGYIDTIIKGKFKNRNEDIYVMIDYKAVGNTDKAKKRYQMLNYRAQLALYKFFWSKQTNIPLEQIRTFFCLVERSGKIEWVEVRAKKDFMYKIIDKANDAIKQMGKTELPKYNEEYLKCKYCNVSSICQKAKREGE